MNRGFPFFAEVPTPFLPDPVVTQKQSGPSQRTTGPASGLPIAPELGPGNMDIPSMSVEEQSSAGQDDEEGIRAERAAQDIAFPLFGSAQITPQVSPGFENYVTLAGKEGKQVFDETFRTLPQEIGQAQGELADIQAQKQEALAKHYETTIKDFSSQNALMAQRRMERQGQIDQQMASIQQATDRYTADLADRGQFWKNPWNVMSAIVTSFMSLTGDPQAGLRLVNQQVLNDWNQRRELANTSLGAMRSNLEMYRQIAGDKDVGDQIALAQSWKTAALEVERIGAQFGGPEFRKKAEIMKKELMMRANTALMSAYNSSVYNAPGKVPAPVMKEFEAMGKAMPGTVQSYKGSFRPGPVSEGPTSSYGSAKAAGKIPDVSEETSQIHKDLFESRAPGSYGAIQRERTANVQEALADIGVDPRLYREGMSDAELRKLIPENKINQFTKAMIAARKYAAEDTKDIAKAVAPVAERLNSYRALDTQMGVVEEVARRLGETPDSLLSNRAEQLVGSGSVQAIRQWLDKADPSGEDHEKLAQQMGKFVSNFKQGFQKSINDYIHSMSGGAVTPSEAERIEAFVKQSNSWNSTRNFLKLVQQDVGAAYKTAISTSKNPYTGTAYKLRTGRKVTGIDTPGVNSSASQKRDAETQKAAENLDKKVRESKKK